MIDFLQTARAADRKAPRSFGHAEGARRAKEAVEACRELGVEVTLHSIDGRPMIAATTAMDTKRVFIFFWLADHEYRIVVAGGDGATDEWRGRWTRTQAIF